MQTCQNPPELTEDELSAAIDGEADPRVEAHLRDCPHCAARLEQARKIEEGLRMGLSRVDCPSSLELAQYQMDMLDTAEDRDRIAAHLKTCYRCRQDLVDWQHFVEEIGEEEAIMPENTIPMPANPTGRIVHFPKILAEPKSAVRGETRVKRIIAAADSTTIRLSFEPLEDEQLKLTIQLSSMEVDWRHAVVTVRQNGQTVAVCRINDYHIGECQLPNSSPISLHFVAADETLIEFNDISP